MVREREGDGVWVAPLTPVTGAGDDAFRTVPNLNRVKVPWTHVVGGEMVEGDTQVRREGRVLPYSVYKVPLERRQELQDAGDQHRTAESE